MAITIELSSSSGEKAGEIGLNSVAFGQQYRPELIQQVVRVYLLNKRSAAPLLKDRSTVHGTGKKLYRQKHRGAARHSNMRSPQIIGGAVMHKPRRFWNLKINAKMKLGSLYSILSQRLKEERVMVFDLDDKIELGKSKEVERVLSSVLKEKRRESALLIRDAEEFALYKSARNLEKLEIRDTRYLNTYAVMRARNLLFTKKAIERLNTLKAI
jgi:large subunit ribosomal protein L4